jgi:hypothetical protein
VLELLSSADELDGSIEPLLGRLSSLDELSASLDEDELSPAPTLLDDNASSLELETLAELLLGSPPVSTLLDDNASSLELETSSELLLGSSSPEEEDG